MNEQKQRKLNNDCLDIGQLASLRDNELSTEEQTKARAHIQSCQDCAADEQNMAAGTHEIYDLFSGLDAGIDKHMNVASALTAVQARLDTLEAPAENEEHPELLPLAPLQQKNQASRRNRKIFRWSIPAAAAVLLLAILLGPNASALANQFLSMFRVQQFQTVTVNPQTLATEVFRDFQNYSEVQYQMDQTPLPDNPTQAQVQQYIHFHLALPGQMPQGTGNLLHFRLLPGAQATFTFDTAKARNYLNRTGQNSVQIPSQLNGATFNVTTRPGVILNYATSCKTVSSTTNQKAKQQQGAPRIPPTTVQCSGGTPFYVVEIPSPAIQATGKASLKDLRDFILSEPKLSPQMRAILDTLDLQKGIVPLPLPAQVQSQQVTINGAHGVLLADDSIKVGAALWQSNGIIYMTATTASGADILDIAKSIR